MSSETYPELHISTYIMSIKKVVFLNTNTISESLLLDVRVTVA